MPIGLVVLGLVLATSAASAAASDAPATTAPQQIPPGLTKECVPEPVFGGDVCIYEGNRAAEKTVVLVHGINGSAMDWASQIPALTARFHVIAIDLPGFGASTKANVLYSVQNYSEVLGLVIRRYAPRKVSLVGHSLGGAIVLWYAGSHADRIERVVVADVPGVLHRLSLAKHMGGDWYDRLVGQSDAPAPSAVGRFLGEILERLERFPLDPDPVLQSESARERLLGADPARIAGFALAYANFGELLGKIVAPVLIVWGDSDPVATVRTGYVLAAMLPNARLVFVPGGHSPMKEQPVRVTELLVSHLAAAPGGPNDETQPHSTRSVAGDRVARCDRTKHVVFEGTYKELVINDCSDVVVRDATIGRLEVFESTVVLLRTVVVGDKVGAAIVGSEITATATDISGDIAITASRSRLDLAGVRLVGRSASITAEQTSNITFSVSSIESPHRSGSIHEYVEVTRARPL